MHCPCTLCTAVLPSFIPTLPTFHVPLQQVGLLRMVRNAAAMHFRVICARLGLKNPGHLRHYDEWKLDFMTAMTAAKPKKGRYSHPAAVLHPCVSRRMISVLPASIHKGSMHSHFHALHWRQAQGCTWPPPQPANFVTNPHVSRPPGDPQLNSTVDVVKDEQAWAMAAYWMREGTLEADRWR